MLHHKFFLSGSLKVKITGHSCERFFNLCVNHDIFFWQICREGEAYTASMKAADFLKIKRLVKKSGVHISILQKSGIPFFLKQHRKRKFLLLGWIWCCFFLYLLSVHIWKIDIKGNQEVTREQLISYLNQKNIRSGSPKNRIDCKEMAADIRNHFSNITWVAVKKQGTLLEIDIKENTDPLFPKKTSVSFSETDGSSLVSAYDGKIIEIVTRKGIACVASGDEVKKGDLLVSGKIPVTNDEGEMTSICYVQADADILMEISATYTDTFSRTVQQDIYLDKGKEYWYLKIGNQIFSTGKITEPAGQKDFLVEEKQLTVFSDLYLPLFLGKITCHDTKPCSIFLSEAAAEAKAWKRLEKFIVENKEKGVQISKKNVKIDTGMTICKCICKYQAYVSETDSIPATQVDDNKERTNS